MEVGVARAIDVSVQTQHRSRIVVLCMNPRGDVPQRVDDGNITAQRRRRRAGVELEARLQEEGFGCEAQNETTIGECVCEAVPDIPESQNRVPDSRSRSIPEVIVIGVPRRGFPGPPPSKSTSMPSNPKVVIRLNTELTKVVLSASVLSSKAPPAAPPIDRTTFRPCPWSVATSLAKSWLVG